MIAGIQKTRLLTDLRARVDADLEGLIRRQQDIQAGATHEENRSEHAKDTRATEQSYLARGLAKRVDELERTRDALATLSLVAFGRNDAIGVSALVTLQSADEDELQRWWLVPGAGGFELDAEGIVVRTLTPASPMGRALIGLSIGEEARVTTPRGERSFEVIDVL